MPGWEVTLMPGQVPLSVKLLNTVKSAYQMGVTASGEQVQYCRNSQCREEGHSFIYQLLSPSPCSLLSSRNYNLKICTKPPLPLFLNLMPSYHSIPLEPHGPYILSFWLGTNHIPQLEPQWAPQ